MKKIKLPTMSPKMQKALPKIALGAGLVSGAATVVLACRATTKLKPVIDEAKADLEKIAAVRKDSQTEGSDSYGLYSDKAYYQDLVKVYAKVSWKIVKLYSGAFIAGTLSLAGILSAVGLLNKKNAAAMAACAAVEQGFASYRERVIAEYGEDADFRLHTGLVSEEVDIPGTHVPLVDENGEVKTDKKGNPIEVPEKKVIYRKFHDDGKYSPYARFFDSSTTQEATDDPSYNRFFLEAAQSSLNDKFHAQGYLFLNDVYDALGMERCAAGQAIGWLDDPDGKYPGHHDCYISFGIYNICQENKAFVNGYEETVLLDFNYDGNIVAYVDEVTRTRKRG